MHRDSDVAVLAVSGCYACIWPPAPVYVVKVSWGILDFSIYWASPAWRLGTSFLLIPRLQSCILPCLLFLLFSAQSCCTLVSNLVFSPALFLVSIFIYIRRLFYDLYLYPVSLYNIVVAQPFRSNPEATPTAEARHNSGNQEHDAPPCGDHNRIHRACGMVIAKAVIQKPSPTRPYSRRRLSYLPARDGPRITIHHPTQLLVVSLAQKLLRFTLISSGWGNPLTWI